MSVSGNGGVMEERERKGERPGVAGFEELFWEEEISIGAGSCVADAMLC